MFQHEGNGFGVEANVEGVENRSDHRHTKVALDHRRNVRKHGRHGISTANTTAGQGRGKPAATLINLLPVIADGAVDHRRIIRIHISGALDEINRRLNGVIGIDGVEPLLIDRGHCGIPQ